jgi:hypothetical protein
MRRMVDAEEIRVVIRETDEAIALARGIPAKRGARAQGYRRLRFIIEG